VTLESPLLGKLARRVREGAVGKGPEPRAPRRRPTSPHVRCGGRAGETDQEQPWHRAPVRPYIIGRYLGSAIATLVERVTKYVVLVHLPGGYKAQQLRDAMITQTSVIPASMRKTLTWDQGRELVLHEQISAATGFDIFFCDPHSPWQRGLNENTNGLLRQYFPKSTDLSVHTANDLRRVATELNHRPRAGLRDRTPAEVMREFLDNANSPFATTG
jgi:IS30 family transposase